MLEVGEVDVGNAEAGEVEPEATPEGAALDGREIGEVVAALQAGLDHVDGIDPRRVARVRHVLEQLR